MCNDVQVNGCANGGTANEVHSIAAHREKLDAQPPLSSQAMCELDRLNHQEYRVNPRRYYDGPKGIVMILHPYTDTSWGPIRRDDHLAVTCWKQFGKWSLSLCLALHRLEAESRK
jgi:hypothetical protein